MSKKDEGIEEEIEEEEEESDKEDTKTDNKKKETKKVNKKEKNEINSKGKNIKQDKNKNKKNSKKNLYHINEKFEKEICKVYKTLSKINKIIEDNNEPKEGEEEEEDDEEEKEDIKSQINKSIQSCEKKLRTALNICKNDPNLIINRNIIDKLSRIILNNRININYIIGNIYMALMKKKYLFDYDDDNFEINDLLLFVNKVIQFREEIQNTRISISYDYYLTQFLFFIKDQFELDEDQLEGIEQVLEENKEIDHKIKMSSNYLYIYFIKLLTDELEIQPNIYEQYQVFIQNKKTILKMIESTDIKDANNYEWFLTLGKYLAYMFFNKSANLYVEKDENLEDDNLGGELMLFYDGKKDKNEIKLINGEKYNILIDEKIEQMRISLGDIIIYYSSKFIDINNLFEIQYLIFILLSRLYLCKYEKHKKSIIPILAKSIINMCFFKNSPMRTISIFINKILESEKQEYSELKNLLSQKILEAQKKKGFLYKKPNKENNKDNIIEEDLEEILGDETLFLLHNDLKLGFFNQKIIEAGEKFIFYEEISNNYSLLDFCFNLTDYDIKFTLTDMTLDKIIYTKDRVYSLIGTPFKMEMFFTEPRILKFEFDNSYSWIRSKTIKYKMNIFYPKYPYKISEFILKEKYIKEITKTKKLLNKKNKGKKNNINNVVNNAIPNKLLIIKLNGNNKVFNCNNVEDNLEAINSLQKNGYLSILSIFIKLKEKEDNKSYFYYYNKDNKDELIQRELTQENFENYLNQEIKNTNLTIINLYLINKIINNLSEYPIQKILGFEPIIRAEASSQNILFVVQNLNQAQILYYIYTQLINNEFFDVIIIINYIKNIGYRISLFNNEEIIESMQEFKDLNKELNEEENAKIIIEGIKNLNFGEERKIKLILANIGDNKDSDNVLDKLKENIEKNGTEIKNMNLIKIDMEFKKQFINNSHIFYLND